MNPDHILDTVSALDTLSDLPRTGWLLRGVRPCESIADHTHGVTLTAMLMADTLAAEGVSIDVERVLRMAVLHDAAEAATGDIPMPQKTDALEAALGTVEERIVSKLLPARLVPLWREVEAGESVEARVVRAADKVHMMLKAWLYERGGRGHLEEFWTNPANFRDRGLPLARALFTRICERAGHPHPTLPED